MNPILDELHAVRERLLTEAGGTLDGLVERLQAEERQSDRPRYRSPPTAPCETTTNPDAVAMGSQPGPAPSV